MPIVKSDIKIIGLNYRKNLELANSFEGENEKENRQKWRLRAYDNSNNSKEIQALIQDCMDKDSIFDINAIWQIINKRFEE